MLLIVITQLFIEYTIVFSRAFRVAKHTAWGIEHTHIYIYNANSNRFFILNIFFKVRVALWVDDIFFSGIRVEFPVVENLLVLFRSC